MGLLVVLVILSAVAAAAARWGVDSREYGAHAGWRRP